MSAYPASSLVDIYGVGAAASSPVMDVATTGPAAAAVRLALGRQRLLEFSIRHHHNHHHHHHRHRHPSHTVSAPTAGATSLLDPSAFCLPMVSIIFIFIRQKSRYIFKKKQTLHSLAKILTRGPRPDVF